MRSPRHSMHELAICQSLLQQVLELAAIRGARRVERIALRIGPLSGVEPDLLLTAFPLVAAGTPCAGAMIAIERIPVHVHCPACGANSGVRSNRLVCASCGAWRVTLVSGDEMLLVGIDLLDVLAVDERERVDV
jgi:hydrogenase nickel incorporation protein HypA/HybF